MTALILEAYPPPTNYVDLRELAAKATGRVYLRSKEHPDGFKLVRRAPSLITGFTLHQSAMDRGEDPHGYVHGGAHWFVTRGGVALHVVDAEWNGPFANGFNAKTISIEMVGLYAGIVGDARTCWDNPATPKHEVEQRVTPEAITTLHQIIRYEYSRCTKLGAHMSKMMSHRQAAASRQSDPGQEPWQLGALPIMAELGLDDGGPGFHVGDGKPNPYEWNPSRTEKY